jgi:NAD(P)H-quinone oxidoreductase subunit 4
VDDPLRHARLDIQLPSVATRETVPAMALAAGVVVLGLLPSILGYLSEATSTAMAQLPVLLAAIGEGGAS